MLAFFVDKCIPLSSDGTTLHLMQQHTKFNLFKRHENREADLMLPIVKWQQLSNDNTFYYVFSCAEAYLRLHSGRFKCFYDESCVSPIVLLLGTDIFHQHDFVTIYDKECLQLQKTLCTIHCLPWGFRINAVNFIRLKWNDLMWLCEVVE